MDSIVEQKHINLNDSMHMAFGSMKKYNMIINQKKSNNGKNKTIYRKW